MIVVADTSPLNYLILIGCDRILPTLYGHLVVPATVIQELSDSLAPRRIASWLDPLPEWIIVTNPSTVFDPSLGYLDAGERDALQFALENHVDLILIDERKGSKEARKRGLETTGTLGVLLSAGEQGLLQPDAAYKKLISETNFPTSAVLEQRFYLDPRFF